MMDTPIPAFEAACAVRPPCRLRLRVGSLDVLVRVAGHQLAECLFQPLRHVVIPDETAGPARITVDAWSVAETGVASPPGLPFEWSDSGMGRIVCSFSDVGTLPRLSLARPFQRVLVPLLAEYDYPAIHGGLIAPPDGDTGLLMLGPNGCGKSTTCLMAVLAGFRLVGEDCLVVRRQADGFIGHSLYRTCCLTAQSRAMLPALPGPVVLPAGAPPDAKGVLTLPHAAEQEGQMRASLPIRAVVFPVVTNVGPTNRVVALPPAEAYRRFLPGLRLMRLFAPDRRQVHHDTLAALVSELPCYRLDLGMALEAVPGVLEQLANKLA